MNARRDPLEHGGRLSRRALLGVLAAPVLAHALPPGQSTRRRVDVDAPGSRRAEPLVRTSTMMGQAGELRAWPRQRADVLEGSALHQAADAAMAEMERIHALTNPQEAGSDVARINGAAGGLSVRVSPEVFALVERAIQCSESSGGAFDMTYASLRRLWTFDGLGAGVLPHREEVARVRRGVDYRRVVLDAAEKSVLLPSAQMRLGLGGLVRGYAVDRAMRMLAEARPAGVMLRVGNVFACAGDVPAEDARVVVMDPRRVDHVVATVDIRDAAAAMAVDHERFFIHRGRRYHAILDPRTGYPARASRTALVTAPRALDAEWMGTAAFVLGHEESASMLARVEGAHALWVTHDSRLVMSPGMKARARVLGKPTHADP